MAEAFARHHAPTILNPASAGLAATHFIAPDTRRVMLEKGITLDDQFPKDFDPVAASKYDIVVNISGFLLPPFQGPALLEWNITDPFNEDITIHREVRDEIERRVLSMIKDLQQNGVVAEYRVDGQRIAPELARKPRLWQRFTKWR